MKQAIHAELMRTRGSSALWITLSGLIFVLFSNGFAEAVKLSGNVQALLNWQGLYVTGIAAPMMTLMAGLVHEREKKAREGGTLWRSTPRRDIILARVVVLWGLSLVFHVVTYGGILGVAIIHHFQGALMPMVSAGLVSWLASAALCVPGLLLAQWVGTIPAVLLAMILQTVGTVCSEKSWWWAVPMTWPVRPCLWVLDIHQNAVPLEPGEVPLVQEPWSALTLCIIAAVIATVGLVVSDAHQISLRGLGDSRFFGREISHSVRGGTWGAVDLAARGGASRWLTLVSMMVLVVVAVSNRPGATAGIFSYALLPLGSMILPVLLWSRMHEGWKMTALVSPLASWMLILRLMAHIAGMAAVGAGSVALEGDTEGLGRRVGLWILTGWVLALLSLVVTIRLSAGVAVAGALMWWIFSITFAGDILSATPLWAVSLPLWAECADTPGRVAIAVTVCAVLIAVLLPVGRKVVDQGARG